MQPTHLKVSFLITDRCFQWFLLLLILPLLSLNSDEMLGRKMPLPAEPTLSGKVVDMAYFKGHVTLVTFMYIGCPPCMNEIAALNRLKAEFAGDSRFQILCIARQMRSQMLDFNSSNKSYFSQLRRALGADSIRYDILPACPEEESKIVRTAAVRKKGDAKDTAINIRLTSECDVLERAFGIGSFPTTLFVDASGIIRKITHGGPVTNNDTSFHNMLQQDIDSMLHP